MFAYPCPSCQQRLQASPERVGQRTICPKCLKPIVIPSPEGPPSDGLVHHRAELIGDTPSTIFVEDQMSLDDADGMDLSLPEDAEEFEVFGNDSAPLAELEAMAAAPLPMAEVAPAVLTAPPTPHRASAFAPPKHRTTDTPMPKPLPTRVSPRDGVVVFHQNAAESADIAAELTTALTMRMKPPAEPPSDLRISTGVWLAMTATGFCLWILSMMRTDDAAAQTLLKCVIAIGVLEIVASYVWVVYLAGRWNSQRGLQALLPPVWLYRLAHPCENTPGFRPLRFFVAGALLVSIALLGATLRPAVQRITGEPDNRTIEIPRPLNSPLARLQDAQSGTLIRPIVEALHEMATDKAAFDATPEETPRLIAELKKLRAHEDDEVRGAALLVLKKWSGLPAVRQDVLDVLRSRSAKPGERKVALDIAREYKDREITRAVASCLEFRSLLDDSDRRAAEALRAIGPPEAEDALLELFEDEDMLLRGVPGLLIEIGGPKSVARLKILAESSSSAEVRTQALRTAEKIAARLK